MTIARIPSATLDMLALADVSWRPVLQRGLEQLAEVHPGYLNDLVNDDYLPSDGRLFAAFAQPLDAVRYVLVGEGPYPRKESATGFCFMDGAVHSLWSENGLSKPVNRATSLRNFMKMLLVANGELTSGNTAGPAVANVALKARAVGTDYIQTLQDLQENLLRHGFLLLNAALVFRPHIPPLKEAKAWQPFLEIVLRGLADNAETRHKDLPTLVLWGKIAEQLKALPSIDRFPKALAEHPYNLSFIDNAAMQALFGPMKLLRIHDPDLA